ncbi:uncharacterized protein [Physcomitrium patens]|uniref:uncharacterized protein isoform X5 n=1 Tax=Physcomitrium patens TaxID=3218 RepID=UPI003CCD041B
MCIFSSSKPETRKVRSIQQRKLAGHGRKNLPPQAQFICLGQLLCCSRLQRSLIPRLRKFLLAGQMLTACEMLNMLQSPLNSFSEFISNEIQMKLPMNRLWKCLQDEELTMDAVGLLPKFSSGNAFAKRIKHATSTGTQMLYLTHSHT